MSLDLILNIYKPSGMTSYDVIRFLKRLLPHKVKIGHGGTLDPAAQGVLTIAVGKATRRLESLPKEKEYRAIICFGMSTTTDDLEGELIKKTDCKHIDPQKIQLLITKHFLGDIFQKVPTYSAVHVDGKRLYRLAQAGTPLPYEQLPVKKISILSFAIENTKIVEREGVTMLEMTCLISCSAGTYIRSIARDLGEHLGVGGALAHLIRTKSGGMEIADSIKLDDVRLGSFLTA